MTDNNNNMALQVHPNPDPEPVVEIEEDIVEEVDKRDETFYSVKGSTISPEEQQTLQNVNDQDVVTSAEAKNSFTKGYNDSPDLPLLPSDDINEPDAADVENNNASNSMQQGGSTVTKENEVMDDYKNSKPEPIPVVIDEGYDQGVNDGQQDLKASNARGPDDKCCQFRCCGCPNGGFQILFCQFFMFCGLMLCAWAMSDCKFIEATAGYPEPYYPNTWAYWNTYPGAPPTLAPTQSPTLEPRPDKRRGFGFFFNETEQGGCGFSNPEGRYWHEEEFRNYLDFLGSDWNIPRILGLVSLGIGWLIFLGTFLLWCCSFVRAIRLLVGMIIFLIVGGLQSSAFAIVGSSFCTDETFTNCEPSRGFWMLLSGLLCYLISGALFCTTKDFPGPVA